MRKITSVAGMLILALFSLCASAQERVDAVVTELAWKSKEMNKALYWTQNRATGKWESRKCSKLVYLGEGISVDNYHGLFLGGLKEDTYLFLDQRKYHWRYPNLELEWMYTRYIYAALLSADDLALLKDLPVGKVVTITPTYINKMSLAHDEYSFPLFLDLTLTLKDLDKPNKVPFITLKRVSNSNGTEAIRFCFGAVTELIDIAYFEVDMATFNNLFTADKKKTYK